MKKFNQKELKNRNDRLGRKSHKKVCKWLGFYHIDQKAEKKKKKKENTYKHY